MNSNALQIEHVQFRYGHADVLTDINLTVAMGEWLALLGPNASGKTTLLHCIAGLLVPQGGDIAICGHSLRHAVRHAKSMLGFACAPERLPPLLTGRQCLEIYAAAKELESIGPDILDLAEELRYTALLDGFVAAYSLGTRQKLAVLLALLGDPALIVFDEAFNGLDPASALALKRHLRARVSTGRCSVLLATHALDVVEHYADRAALLLNGHIAHEWSREELARLRADPDGLEVALAAVVDSQPA